jgi:glycerophosphoryl diester phosphodiesterase
MLVIGHRGAAGLATENSLRAMRAGFEAGADILELDVRLTKDRVPVVIHDFHLYRTHGDMAIISHLTLSELRTRTSAKPIVTLSEVLDEFYGRIELNIEVKGHGTASAVIELLENNYAKNHDDWKNLLISSFKVSELIATRKISENAKLAILHGINPFLFIFFRRKLRLSAVGFHRLFTSKIALKIAKRYGLFTYVYTVNQPKTALSLAQQGFDSIVTNRPDLIKSAVDEQPR